MNYKKRKKSALILMASILMTLPCASCSNNNTKEDAKVYVDLGLPSGTLWAMCNVGADSPEKPGDYYAWGETKTYGEEDQSNMMNYNYAGSYVKTAYNWCTYKFCEGSETSMTKYCISADCGVVDSLRMLEPVDDVATVVMGENWRMPTEKEWKELHASCTWTWVANGKSSGYKVTGPNGNSIFLPAAGARFSKGNLSDVGEYGYYWSNCVGRSNCYNAYCMRFCEAIIETCSIHRGYGRSIRPVCKPEASDK